MVQLENRIYLNLKMFKFAQNQDLEHVSLQIDNFILRFCPHFHIENFKIELNNSKVFVIIYLHW